MNRSLQLAGVALLCLLATWWWWERRVEAPMRAPMVTAETTDDFLYYYPMFHYAFDELRQGRFPHWNPYQLCGTPFFATAQHLLLYPLNALYLLLPTPAAMKATNILHLALAVLFTYCLARVFGLTAAAALTSGLIFAFSPVVTHNIYAPHHLYGAVWIPLHLALVRRILMRRRTIQSAVLLGVAVAAQYLGGYPMHCMFSLYLMGLYVLWFAATSWRGRPWQRLGGSLAALAAAGALAVLLALPQLLPALELARLSPRPPGGLTLGMVQPTFAPGWTAALQTAAGMALPTRDSGFASGFTPHIGAAGLALAVLGAVCGRRRANAAFFAIVGLGSGLLALGRSTPLYGLYFALPTGNWFRGPNRFFVLTALALGMLAGMGVDALQRGRVGRRTLRVLLAISLALSAGVAVVLVTRSNQLAALDREMQNPILLSGPTSLTERLGWLCAYAAAASAWLTTYLWWERARRLLVAALPLAVYASLFLSFINYAPLPESDPELEVLPPNILRFLQDNQGYERAYVLPWGTFVPSRVLPPRGRTKPGAPHPVTAKSGLMHRLYLVGDRENIYPGRFADYVDRMKRPEDVERLDRLLATAGLAKSDAGIPQADFGVRADAPNLRLLDLAGARFILQGPGTNFDQPAAPERFPLAYESDGVQVYRNTSAYPRAFVVPDVEVIAEPAGVLDRLTSAEFDPLRSVILEEHPPQQPAGGAPPLQYEVRFADYTPGEVTLDVHTSSPGFLVLTDQYYPGWRAAVDGVAVPLYVADYLFRAVFLDGGNHRVVFRYQPTRFRGGLIGAGVGAALVVIGLIVDRRRRALPAR